MQQASFWYGRQVCGCCCCRPRQRLFQCLVSRCCCAHCQPAHLPPTKATATAWSSALPLLQKPISLHPQCSIVNQHHIGSGSRHLALVSSGICDNICCGYMQSNIEYLENAIRSAVGFWLGGLRL